ncbi:MAG: Rrf2 family transcriptional regulator [Magnetococcus sp. WYHC-3]
MKLTAKGRYAVTAMLDLAARPDGAPVTLGDIAARQDISLAFLEQLFVKLRRGGLVRSHRGPAGGYVLALAPERISVGDIIRAVEEPIQMTCGSDGREGCAKPNRCTTHELWARLGRYIHGYLDSITLGGLLRGEALGDALPAAARDRPGVGNVWHPEVR